MRVWHNKLINKAINHYNYDVEVGNCDSSFIDDYDFFARRENLQKYIFVVWTTLGGIPDCTHVTAKKLLFQGSSDCWKYFERTALFWTVSHINDPWIDHIKTSFEYCLYVEREDLIKILFKKSEEYLSIIEYTNNKEYINQKVYPSTYLVHFLIKRWLGENPVKDIVLKFGSGYGIYQKLIDNWDDLSSIESSYWDDLCEYHLKGIGLAKGDKRENEEFLGSGLVPMELINIIKVRKKLGLDIPVINHELFQTPMAKEPKIPTGYDENLDVKYQMVKRTVETKKKWTSDEIIIQLKSECGESANLFM